MSAKSPQSLSLMASMGRRSHLAVGAWDASSHPRTPPLRTRLWAQLKQLMLICREGLPHMIPEPSSLPTSSRPPTPPSSLPTSSRPPTPPTSLPTSRSSSRPSRRQHTHPLRTRTESESWSLLEGGMQLGTHLAWGAFGRVRRCGVAHRGQPYTSASALYDRGEHACLLTNVDSYCSCGSVCWLAFPFS